MKRYLLVLLSICFAFVGCKSKKIENNSIVSDFVLSDTMIKNCEFSEVKLLPSKENLSLFGKIQADNNKLAHVEPIVGGNVLKINVELGDYVKQGQVLAVVQSGEVAEFEKEYLIKKIQENGGNISKTAESIGLERSYLHRKIKAYGIEVNI